MKKSKFSEEQIAFALRQAEGGTSVGEMCRKMGISEATFYNWKKKYGGLGVAELRRGCDSWKRRTASLSSLSRT
jgi:putative transposase